MKRVELKRFAEFLWKATPSDEKTPFAQGTVPDNGAISKNFDADDNKKPGKEFPEDESEKIEGPMSIPRKLCFVMSFNICILYFLALGWLIPCRNLNCDSPFDDILEINLEDFWPRTNVETLNVKGLPSLAMLGYEHGDVKILAALDASDGASLWNNSLSFIPSNIQCNFEIIFDTDKDGIGDCLLTGYNDVYAFNASNGYVFWQQNISSDEGNIQSKFHPTQKRGTGQYLTGIYGNKLVVLNALNGTKISEAALPCRAPIDIRIVPSVINTNFTFWNLVCDYGDIIEAWAFGEQDVLNVGNLENAANATGFAILFSGSDSGGSIDLGCDVTTIPGGPLLLSWADRVVMVTPEATAWERHFPDPMTVADIEVGHFTKSNEFQIAAAVRNESDSIIYILEIKNGSIVDSVTLQDRQAQTMHKVSGSLDSLVLKSISLTENTSIPVFNFSDPVPTQKTNFALVGLNDKSLDVKEIISTSVVRESTVNTQTNGESDLLVLKSEDGQTSLLKLVIHRSKSEENPLCFRVNHPNHYTTEI